MTYSRFFIQFPLKPYYISQQAVTLPVDTSHYMQRVLRLRLADKVTVFDGLGGEYTAEICTVTKKTLSILLLAYDNVERESALKTTLVQAISKPEHMDFSIQKAVELGVTEIVPLITTRSPALKAKVLEKRHGHWQKIIYSACEQCGRNHLPVLHPVIDWHSWLQQPQTTSDDAVKWILEASASQGLANYQSQKLQAITLVIGAEGGLTEEELQKFNQAGYQSIVFGQRILRTETASTALLAICQACWG